MSQLSAKCCPRQESMAVRSRKWLQSQPTLPEVKKAVLAIVGKVRSGNIVAEEDARSTAELLTEFYVDQGGDLYDLPSLDEAAPSELALLHHVPTSLLDASPLCPDVPAAPALTGAEKRRVFEQLRCRFNRPGGV